MANGPEVARIGLDSEDVNQYYMIGGQFMKDEGPFAEGQKEQRGCHPK